MLNMAMRKVLLQMRKCALALPLPAFARPWLPVHSLLASPVAPGDQSPAALCGQSPPWLQTPASRRQVNDIRRSPGNPSQQLINNLQASVQGNAGHTSSRLPNAVQAHSPYTPPYANAATPTLPTDLLC